MSDKCPVDHGSSKATDQCPVDHTARSTWGGFLPNGHPKPAPSSSYGGSLPTDRETTSIPKADEGNWVYPSEAQFFAAMARKNHNPQAADMRTIVPIHNAVNERAWAEVLKWEVGRGGDNCGGVKLVNFKGKPSQMSPKARGKSLLGYAFTLYLSICMITYTTYSYTPPFDRHDWVVDRCGTKIRYVIDFYTGKSDGPSSNNLSFFLDVRPALDNWEGVKMRAERFWEQWVGKPNISSSSNAKPADSS
jgi:cytochrome c heme-lyase